MKRVTGLGGIFFKAKDPKALYEWYRLHLGIQSNPDGSGANWRDADHPEIPGCCVWGIFPRDTTYFGSGQLIFMVNFRVENLDELLRLLREEGVPVDPKVEEYDYGKFACVTDPEGNRVELWEPPKGNQRIGPARAPVCQKTTRLSSTRGTLQFFLQPPASMKRVDLRLRPPDGRHHRRFPVMRLVWLRSNFDTPAMTMPKDAKPVTEELRQRKTPELVLPKVILLDNQLPP